MSKCKLIHERLFRVSMIMAICVIDDFVLLISNNQIISDLVGLFFFLRV